MSEPVERRVTVAAPAEFVRAFLLDIGNWPKIWASPFSPGPFRWDGEPWTVSSRIVSAGKLFGIALNEQVVASSTGELFCVSQRTAGMSYTTSCRIVEAGTDQCVVALTTILGGWGAAFAHFTPQSQLEAAEQFSMPALKTESELAWLRRNDEGRGPRGTPEDSPRSSRELAPATPLMPLSAAPTGADNPLAPLQVILIAILAVALVVLAVSAVVFVTVMRMFMQLQP